MKRKLILLALSFASVFAYAQNVGINTPTPEGALDVNGDIIFRPGETSVHFFTVNCPSNENVTAPIAG